MRHRSLLDCEQTGRSLIGSQERFLMLTLFHKMTVLTVNTMHQNLLCCGARMAFTQSKHGASRLGIPHVHKSGNCKFLNETDPHPNSELEASKHEAKVLTPPVFMHLLSALKVPTPHVAWIYV
jgi:hypothetical protein